MYTYDSIAKWQTNLNTVKVLKYTFLSSRYVNGQQAEKKTCHSTQVCTINMAVGQKTGS